MFNMSERIIAEWRNGLQNKHIWGSSVHTEHIISASCSESGAGLAAILLERAPPQVRAYMDKNVNVWQISRERSIN